MNRNDINRMYTEAVTQLLNQGYQINPFSMDGSQGEIAHIDMTNGIELIRVLLEWDLPNSGDDMVMITLGKSNIKPQNSDKEIVWNNQLNVVSQTRLVRIDVDYYVTVDEAKRIEQVRLDRYIRRGGRYTIDRRELGAAYKSIALRWLRRQPGMKRAQLNIIEKMEKLTFHSGKFFYKITAKGHDFTLAPNRDWQ